MIPAVIGFIFISGMMGIEMQKKMAEYQNALEIMSNEAVEYVRGVPVVKTFGQTIHSFTKFKNAIDISMMVQMVMQLITFRYK